MKNKHAVLTVAAIDGLCVPSMTPYRFEHTRELLSAARVASYYGRHQGVERGVVVRTHAIGDTLWVVVIPTSDNPKNKQSNDNRATKSNRNRAVPHRQSS